MTSTPSPAQRVGHRTAATHPDVLPSTVQGDPFLTQGAERLPVLLLGPPSRQMALVHHGVQVARAAVGARIVYSGPGPWPDPAEPSGALQVMAFTPPDAWHGSPVAVCADLDDLADLLDAVAASDPRTERPTWVFLRTERLIDHVRQVVRLRHHGVRTVIVSTGERIGHTYARHGHARVAHHLIDTTIDWRPSLDWPADRDDTPEPARVHAARTAHPWLWTVPVPADLPLRLSGEGQADGSTRPGTPSSEAGEG